MFRTPLFVRQPVLGDVTAMNSMGNWRIRYLNKVITREAERLRGKWLAEIFGLPVGMFRRVLFVLHLHGFFSKT